MPPVARPPCVVALCYADGVVEQLHDNDDLDGLLYWPLDEVRTDVACPQCDQNLRGLRGRVVSCPECGHRCDIAALIGVRWNYSWLHTPLVSLVLSPASLALGSAILIGLYVAVTHFLYLPAVGWDWAAMGAGVLWIVAMLRVPIVFGDGRGSQECGLRVRDDVAIIRPTH